MGFNHSNYLYGWLCVTSICNYERKMLFFFDIKIVIYLTHNMYNLMKIIKLLMKLI